VKGAVALAGAIRSITNLTSLAFGRMTAPEYFGCVGDKIGAEGAKVMADAIKDPPRNSLLKLHCASVTNGRDYSGSEIADDGAVAMAGAIKGLMALTTLDLGGMRATSWSDYYSGTELGMGVVRRCRWQSNVSTRCHYCTFGV
jgi:hypothetical protein